MGRLEVGGGEGNRVRREKMGRKGRGWTKEGGVCACGVIRYLELKNLRQDETRRDGTKCDYLLVLL